MSNSPLVSFTKISPNKTPNRNHVIDTITIHCVVGQCTVETLGNVFAPTSKAASSNYGVGYDGRIGMYVEEKDRSWCSSNAENDHRAITIEVASDTTHPFAVTDKAYNALIDLVTDICKRNNIKKLVWSTNKTERVNHLNGCNMTVHRDYASKSCPGDYLYNRHGDIAAKVNARLNGSDPTPSYDEKTVNYDGIVTASTLNCRNGAGTDYTIVTTYAYGANVHISKEKNGWGYTGKGWVYLEYIKKIEQNQPAPAPTPTQKEEDEDMTQEKFNELATEWIKEMAKKNPHAYSAEARAWAESNGYIQGTNESGDKAYQRYLTREEAITLLYRILNNKK